MGNSFPPVEKAKELEDLIKSTLKPEQLVAFNSVLEQLRDFAKRLGAPTLVSCAMSIVSTEVMAEEYNDKPNKKNS